MRLKRQELSKAELLRGSTDGHGLDTTSHFQKACSTTSKDDLIPALERSENEGLSPTYLCDLLAFYGGRFSCSGSDRSESRVVDALRVQLFVRGYGLKVSKSGERYADEFLRGLRELRPQLRSQYFHRDASRASSHLAAVERQLGSIDPRFEAAGLKQPPEFYLDQARLGFGLLSRSLFAPLEGLLLAGRMVIRCQSRLMRRLTLTTTSTLFGARVSCKTGAVHVSAHGGSRNSSTAPIGRLWCS